MMMMMMINLLLLQLNKANHKLLQKVLNAITAMSDIEYTTVNKLLFTEEILYDYTVLQSLGKMPSRLDQIRLEETVAQHDQEAAHERCQ